MQPPTEAIFTKYLFCLHLLGVLGKRKAYFGHFDESDLCCEVRAAAANRMHSAALLRNWSKLGQVRFNFYTYGNVGTWNQRYPVTILFGLLQWTGSIPNCGMRGPFGCVIWKVWP